MDKNKTPYKLLTLLADGRFHSGQELGKALGITRSGIWKNIQQLEKYGLEINAVTGKGYRIPQGIELLDETLVRQSLSPNSRAALTEIVLLTTVDSTNEYLVNLARRGAFNNVACFAEYQSAARGRVGRPWVAGFASSICLSVLWHFRKNPAQIVGLSLVVAIAVVKALQAYGISSGIQLKWPNDVLFNGKKLAGILIDLVTPSSGWCSAVIGVGLNVSIPYPLGHSINQPWIDLTHISAQTPKRNRLAGLLLNDLIASLQQFNTTGLAPFVTEWKSYDAMLGKNVTITTAAEKIHGIMRGLSDKGELILENDKKELHCFLCGEVSLRLTEGAPLG